MTGPTLDAVMAGLFPAGHEIADDTGEVFAGVGRTGATDVRFCGTRDEAYIGADTAHALAGHVLAAIAEAPGQPILMLVDNRGQRLSRRDELLGNNAYLAHLATCLEVARRRGHPVASLVWNRAVSGGFLACGMSAAACFALEGAEIGVMNLDAMARITQIPKERLQELNRTSAIFGPGAANYLALGVLEAVWPLDAGLPALLDAAFRRQRPADQRRRDGAARGGRTMAADVAARVRGIGCEAAE